MFEEDPHSLYNSTWMVSVNHGTSAAAFREPLSHTLSNSCCGSQLNPYVFMLNISYRTRYPLVSPATPPPACWEEGRTFLRISAAPITHSGSPVQLPQGYSLQSLPPWGALPAVVPAAGGGAGDSVPGDTQVSGPQSGARSRSYPGDAICALFWPLGDAAEEAAFRESVRGSAGCARGSVP